MRKKLNILFIILIGIQSVLFAQKTISQDERMQWWRDARFGMFIHWGLYCIPAGEWNGREYPQIGEWIISGRLGGVSKLTTCLPEARSGSINPEHMSFHSFHKVLVKTKSDLLLRKSG